jgi:hypothetical protein
MKKFKVIGSYTIQTFYSKIFEISDWEILKNLDLNDYITDLALEDQSESLKSWDVEDKEVIGNTFYIDDIIPLDN